jgi:membrane dipeptidase
MKYVSIPGLAIALLCFSCSEKKPVDRMNDEQLLAFADKLAHQYIIADGHVDLPYHLKEKNFVPNPESMNQLITTDDGDFDYEKARKGGLDAPFMSIYIPARYQLLQDKGKGLADSLMVLVEAICGNMPDRFVMAQSPDEIEKNFKNGKISFPMGMENGAPIGDEIKNVRYFHDRGIRYITLTHTKDNQICDSSGDTTHTWNGLSPFGKEAVKEMNRVGIMIDISHVDDSTFFQVMKLSSAPCIASHSSCRYFAPTSKRDMTDDMIKKLGDNGGVMLINFYNPFLDSLSAKQNDINSKKLKSLLAEKGLKETDAEAKRLTKQFRKENIYIKTTIEKVADHIDHVVKLAGIDHVGFGSDFDGVDGDLPIGLEDASRYPNLIYTLLKRGYTEAEIEKICSGNLFRVWRKVEQMAGKEG